MENIDLRILDYFEVLDEIERITSNPLFKKQESVTTLHDNIEIPYYTLGNGENHIVVCGGTHGSEIISVDFVLRLMDNISNKKGVFSDIDLESKDGYTFHFIPLHNPEGYIISTSAIRTLIGKDAAQEEIEKISKEYFMNYRQDDINAKNNPDDKSQKLHQKMFDSVTYECIPEQFKELRESVKEIYANPKVPHGSIVVHRGTGLGVETNRSVLTKALTDEEVVYGTNRYNNIDITVPGPLGIVPDDNIVENKFLKGIIDNLYKEGKYTGMLTYHGTGGMIYSKLSDDDLELIDDVPDDYIEDKYRMSVINRILTRKYQEDTKYVTPNGSWKPGYRMVLTPSLKDVDENLRMIYPGILLIELSYMGGNPIGPLGDKENNYVPTIEHNLEAAHNFFKTAKYLKPAMYGEVDFMDNDVTSEFVEDTNGKTR